MTAGQVIATAQLGNLVFAPALGMAGIGYASFTFSVQDLGRCLRFGTEHLTVNVVTPVGQQRHLTVPTPP